jgi:hypothetical protein
LLGALDRALVAVAAAFLSESPTPLRSGVIGPDHVAEWAAAVAAVRASPYRRSFGWAYRALPVIYHDPDDRPVASYRLFILVDDQSMLIERQSGRTIRASRPDRPDCRAVTLHEEGGTLKVIGMRPVPPAFCG